MTEQGNFPFRGRGVFADLLFSVCFALALASLVWEPVLGANQQWEQARTIQFQGHQASVATSGDVGRFAAPKGPPGLTDPVLIPGGLVLPPQIHVFAPGPVNQGFQGVDAEPSVITNYRGFSAIGYPEDSARLRTTMEIPTTWDLRCFAASTFRWTVRITVVPSPFIWN